MNVLVTPELSCPRCRQPLTQKRSLGLSPRPLEPGEFTFCARCGSILVLNAERALRFATRDEIEDEVRVRPYFGNVVRLAEHTRREFLAARSGFKTPASLARARGAGGAQ